MNKLATICFTLLIFAHCVVGYSVVGNQIYGPDGKVVRIRGVDRCSFEWSPTGEQASLADYQNMASWGFNVVRIAMNQDFWLSGSATYSSNYAATIAQQVAWVKQAGMGVILDLHWSDMGNLRITSGAQQLMADTNSITFWSQVAAAYKNDPSVMFELYNEPHDVSWSVWLNGGNAGGFQVAGMQQLYNAVRATGANNVVLVNGLNWAFDLSGVSQGYAVTGTNIAYATHPYDYDGKQAGDWDAAFGNLAATYPVIMTEFGQYCANDGYVATLLAYAERKGIHWTAWAWYPGGCQFPAVINDWSGTPTAIGTIVKTILSSARTAVIPPPAVTPVPTRPSTPAPTPAPPTNAPTSTPTVAPTGAPTGAPTVPAGGNTATSGGCSASNIVVTSTLSSGPWTDNGKQVFQYNMNVQNTCDKTLTGLTLSATNWNVLQFWNVQMVGANQIGFASYVTVPASSTYSGIGYQNLNGPASFTVVSATFSN